MSFRWNFDLVYSNSMCRHSSIPTSNLIGLEGIASISGVGKRTAISFSVNVFYPILLLIVTLKKYLNFAEFPT